MHWGCRLCGNNATIVYVIPPFTRAGWLPAGEHECEWPEFLIRFSGTPDNGRRRRLIVGLAQVLWLLAQAGCRVVIVDGSFVSRERWPRDFDLCYEAQGVHLELLPPVLLDFSLGRNAQKRRFGGEALPGDFLLEANDRTIRQAFGFTREGAPKGVIRLEPQAIAEQVREFLEELAGGAGESYGTSDNETSSSGA